MPILLGAIADDFTGATDLANTLVQQGMRAVQLIGIPDEKQQIGDADAVIIALKSRSTPVEQAIGDSMAALKWLCGQGAQQIFFKYCSTFDSTPDGNIGPVADALMSALDTDLSVICPAFPTNHRTIYQGHLFVKDQLLSDSPMKDHPLNPMRDSSLPRLMTSQCGKRVGLVPFETISAGVEATTQAFEALRRDGVSYVVADALTDDDLITIGTASADHRLITGGSGVALGLPDNFRRLGRLGEPQASMRPQIDGRSAVLAGSCSEATRGQIAKALLSWPGKKIDVGRIAAGTSVTKEILQWSGEMDKATPILIYASADPDEVATNQEEFGAAISGEMVERVMGEIALGLVEQGVRRLIVAGGETSGAVVSALDIKSLRIGPEIDPGVPWTETLDEPRLALALKSGNFGGVDFFDRALGMLP